MTLQRCLSINDLVPYEIVKVSLQVAFDDRTMTKDRVTYQINGKITMSKEKEINMKDFLSR